MGTLTVSSALIAPTASDRPLTPAMVAVLWVIADELDRRRVPAGHSEPVWLEIPSKRLRGEGGRSDNVWLRHCLERLTGIQLQGQHHGDDWFAVMIAEAQITEGGTMTRLLVPPAAIQAIRGPETFAKLETRAAFKLIGAARKLYALLADKKRLGQPFWVYDLKELRGLLDVHTRRSYERFNNFRFRVLDPAVQEINDFGTVHVTMTPQKVGRSIRSVRFDWQWKDTAELRATDEAELPIPVPPARGAAPEDQVAGRKEGTPEERAEASRRILRDAGFRG